MIRGVFERRGGWRRGEVAGKRKRGQGRFVNLSCPAGSSWAERPGPDSPPRRSGAKASLRDATVGTNSLQQVWSLISSPGPILIIELCYFRIYEGLLRLDVGVSNSEHDGPILRHLTPTNGQPEGEKYTREISRKAFPFPEKLNDMNMSIYFVPWEVHRPIEPSSSKDTARSCPPQHPYTL